MRLRIGVDIGGTFTDLVAISSDGAVTTHKTLSTPHDYGEGIVWQQMRNIVAGQGYTPLGVYPAIVYHYPPVYHLVVHLVGLSLGVASQ